MIFKHLLQNTICNHEIDFHQATKQNILGRHASYIHV